MRNEGASSSSLLPSVTEIAGALAGFVSNRFSPFAWAAPTPSSDLTTTTARAPPSPSSSSTTSSASRGTKLLRSSSSHPQLKSSAPSPASDLNKDYLARLGRQVQGEQDTRSPGLALRLQQKEEQPSTTGSSAGRAGEDYASRCRPPI